MNSNLRFSLKLVNEYHQEILKTTDYITYPHKLIKFLVNFDQAPVDFGSTVFARVFIEDHVKFNKEINYEKWKNDKKLKQRTKLEICNPYDVIVHPTSEIEYKFKNSWCQCNSTSVQEYKEHIKRQRGFTTPVNIIPQVKTQCWPSGDLHLACDGESISTPKTSTKTDERNKRYIQKFFRDWNAYFPTEFWIFGIVCWMSFMISQPQN